MSIRTPGSADGQPAVQMPAGESLPVPPFIVLGLGNLLLQDDGVGLAILEAMQADASCATPGGVTDRVEFVDGGTQGISLLGRIGGRRGLLILDAIRLDDPSGTLHSFEGADLPAVLPPSATSGHEGNCGDLLRAALLLGSLPPQIALVGVEPEEIRTGMGLSPKVRAAVPTAAAAAESVLAGWIASTGAPAREPSR